MVDLLRLGSRAEQSEEIGKLYNRMHKNAERMAVKMLGVKAGRVDLQPESVVMSVMLNELPRLAEVCNDDQHLEARLLLAIRHNFIDRLRVRKHINPDSRDASGQQMNFDAPDNNPGPSSVVEAFVDSKSEREALAKMIRILTGACKNADERTMVEQFLIKDQGWSAISKQLGKNESATKVSFHRLRQRLLAHVMQPLQFILSGPEWQVVDVVCIQRRSVGDAAAFLGMSQSAIMAVFEARIVPILRCEYSAAGLNSLSRLIGKVKPDEGPSPVPVASKSPVNPRA